MGSIFLFQIEKAEKKNFNLILIFFFFFFGGYDTDVPFFNGATTPTALGWHFSVV
jgi:hypothetical protein